MKQGVITPMALVLCLSFWPPMCGLATVDPAYDTAAGITANSSSDTRMLQLAKHQDSDTDADYQESEHQHHHHGKHHENEEKSYDGQQFCGPYFKRGFVPYFQNYYSRDNYANLPPGLRKHVLKTSHLPPGLEKKYESTGQLRPGLQKRFRCGQTLPPNYSPYLYPVPNVAYERVGPLPPDSKLYLYGDDLILLNGHTKAIVDILRGAY
jgi:hypothetical protein